jgi:hypothetical protein
MLLNRVSALWLATLQAAIDLVAAGFVLVTGTPLDAGLVIALNGFAAAFIALIANAQAPLPASKRLARLFGREVAYESWQDLKKP